MGIRTVISADDSLYLYWQSQLLQHSHAKVGQPGTLTRLVATSDPTGVRHIDGFDSVATRLFNPHPVTDDFYPPYNKPGSLGDWLGSIPLTNETLLLIDPDCVFTRAIETEVTDGHPIGEQILYMDPAGPNGAPVIKRHCRKHKRRVQALGIPILITPSDLLSLCPRWYEATCQIRDDETMREVAGWVSEMWGYVIAAAELGLHHELGHHSCVQFDEHIGRPILNYCYHSENAAKTWQWNKRDYRPWARPDPAPDDVPVAGKYLHSLVEEVAAREQYRCLE